MHIYIDESGTFVASDRSPSLSAVGSLVVPTHAMQGLLKLYRRVRRRLPKQSGEVKGRLLSETDVGEVAEICRKVGCIFDVVVIDMGWHKLEQIELHRAGQAEAITKHLTAEHHPDFAESVWQLRRQLEKMPLQLYVQAVAMSNLVYHTANQAQTYFAFRSPAELKAYHWCVDAKGRDTTPSEWEQWWQRAVLPMTESRTFDEPFIWVEGGDYRWLDRFKVTPGEYKRQFVKDEGRGDFFDLKLLLQEDLRFSPDPEEGLEIVDILVNALRRSLAGNFSREGWLPLRTLMIHRKEHYPRMIALSHDEAPAVPYMHVLTDFRQGGRSMLPARLYAK